MGTLTNKLYRLSFSLIFPSFSFLSPELQLENVLLKDMPPWSPLGCDSFVRFFLFWWPWQLWGLLVSRSAECPSAGICLKFSPWFDCGYGFLAGKPTEAMCHFYYIISEVHAINRIYHHWCWPSSPTLMGYLSGLSIIKLLVCSPLHISVWALCGKKSLCSAHTCSGGSYHAQSLMEYLCELFGNSWMRVFFLFSYLSIYLYQYGPQNIYLMLF